MMMFDKLDDTNFMLFAAKFYENPNCMGVEEFEADLNRIKYIKRLFRKYKDGGELRERLILNHLIVLYNVFYHEACTKILCLKLQEYLQYLKPFLVYLNYWPERLDGIGANNVIIIGSTVPMDTHIVEILRKI